MKRGSRERFLRHGGNADVVRQELARVLDIEVSLRTVQRVVAGYRQQLTASALATMLFETLPGHQIQIDLGEKRMEIGGEKVRVTIR